jgi:hypothetical protein
VADGADGGFGAGVGAATRRGGALRVPRAVVAADGGAGPVARGATAAGRVVRRRGAARGSTPAVAGASVVFRVGGDAGRGRAGGRFGAASVVDVSPEVAVAVCRSAIATRLRGGAGRVVAASPGGVDSTLLRGARGRFGGSVSLMRTV